MDLGFDLEALGKQLGAVAPTIATTLLAPVLGPAAPLVGMGVQALSTALFGTPDRPASDVAAALPGATADQLLAIKNADNAFKLAVQKMGIDMAQIAAGDRASARQMQIETRSWVVPAVGLTVILGFFGLISLMAFHAVPEANKDLLNVLLGALGAASTAVVQFFFGSSAGSEAKTQMIYASTPQQ